MNNALELAENTAMGGIGKGMGNMKGKTNMLINSAPVDPMTKMMLKNAAGNGLN